MTTAPIVTIERASKLYVTGTERIWVLRNVSLSIDRGDLMVIEGPSGSGKSTLLNLVSGLTRPTKGNITVEGRDLAKLDLDQLAILRRKRIGFVFQSPNLFPHLTALENVMLPSRGATEERGRELLEMVGLGARLANHPHQLSGGEQQRVAVARALINNPGIVLADEPTGSLDRKKTLEIMNLFRKINEKGSTFLVVSHDPVVASLGLKRVVIEDGRLVDEDD
ncbi:MAG: ABC transporter ATP-binding protein [Candidatus Undinarchaeales archaeon]|jgi:putative ABC transport system ATP-binding protein|nr:ABC transporter ATP-binding protein [Candidatus Undinarchaeales archaeon]MDP7494639.1 ABC transporter ATP-binding protein [Candidatus Undinarchaeales archaeon]